MEMIPLEHNSLRKIANLAGRLLGATLVFVLILLPVLALDLASRYLSGISTSQTMLWVLQIAQYTLIVVDVLVFLVIVISEAVRTIRSIFGHHDLP